MHGRDGKDAAQDVVGQNLRNRPSAPDLCYAGVAHYGRVATQLSPLLMIKTQQRSHFSQQQKPEISLKVPPSGGGKLRFSLHVWEIGREVGIMSSNRSSPSPVCKRFGVQIDGVAGEV